MAENNSDLGLDKKKHGKSYLPIKAITNFLDRRSP